MSALLFVHMSFIPSHLDQHDERDILPLDEGHRAATKFAFSLGPGSHEGGAKETRVADPRPTPETGRQFITGHMNKPSPSNQRKTTTPEMCPVKNRPTRTLITKVPWVNNGNSLHRNGNSRGWMSHNKKVEKKKKLIDYGVGTDYKGGPAQIFRYQKYLRVSAVSRAPHLPIFPLDSDCLPRPPHSDLDFWTPLSCPHGPRSDHEPLLLRPSGLLCCHNQHTLTITSGNLYLVNFYT
ncbi:uncharacterized protein LOC133639708 isoform X1 [Entelurus aequoreus]|uniref:uncharacterized protein LOC133639708 isoform X1 n=2 Tax=Entelurus aequoreus TaxID=161455 RepID=UPI002B1E3DA5|nr:uncharacterized protein LOC133639708 isoform X1 [Entelurus aequoreus]